MDLHPLIVHFPIVCLVAAVLFDLFAHFTRRDHFHQAGLALLLFAALATIPAAYTGDVAAVAALRIPDIEDSLYHHQDLSTFALWSALALGATRVHLVVRKRYVGGWKTIHLTLTVLCALLICWSAYVGGQLVYDFGAGTKASRTTVTQE